MKRSIVDALAASIILPLAALVGISLYVAAQAFIESGLERDSRALASSLDSLHAIARNAALVALQADRPAGGSLGADMARANAEMLASLDASGIPFSGGLFYPRGLKTALAQAVSSLKGGYQQALADLSGSVTRPSEAGSTSQYASFLQSTEKASQSYRVFPRESPLHASRCGGQPFSPPPSLRRSASPPLSCSAVSSAASRGTLERW